MGCKCYRYIDILPLFYRFGFIYLVLQSLLQLLTHYFSRYLIIKYRIATRLVSIPHLPFFIHLQTSMQTNTETPRPYHKAPWSFKLLPKMEVACSTCLARPFSYM
jgi:hypothetical protein